MALVERAVCAKTAIFTEAKHNREWRREYMTLEMKYKEKYNEGKKEGLEQEFL